MSFRSLLQKRAAPPAGMALVQVQALFSDVRSFAVGGGGVCLAALVVALRVGSAVLFAFCGLLAVITIARVLQMYAFTRKSQRSETARRWGRVYNIGAGLHIAAIGLFCLVTFVESAEPLCRMLAMGTVIAYMAGIPGRNFADPRGVDVQIVCAGIPLILAMMFGGVEYALLFGMLLVPYFFCLRTLATRLRGIFEQSSARERDLGEMAATLNTALANMSHGLVMFDRDARATIHNEQLLRLLDLNGANLEGASFTTLFASALDALCVSAALSAAFDARSPHVSVEIAMRTGSTLALTMRMKPDGGAVALVHDVTEEKKAAETIRHLALHDELTGLMNRTQLRHILENLPPARGPCAKAMFYVDLDGFKLVNDTLGHLFGDVLIQKTADRLRAFVGEKGLVARLGGDEFAILCEGHGDARTVYDLAAGIIAALRDPFEVEGHSVVVGASVGIALYPDDASEGPALLGKSDLALYRAKADGRGRWRRFDVVMERTAERRRQLEDDLRKAVVAGEFELLYQPIFDHRLGVVSLCEALIRWRHPERGLLLPGEFIAVAEEMGLIAEIGRWVLERACRDCSRWPQDVGVAVNISALQFRHGDVVRAVGEALSRSHLDPSRLELELTESVLLQDVAFTSMTMELLHRRGVKISLDDFGTGYSSLSYLNQLPLSRVKIDRSFLEGIGESQRALLMLKGLVRLVAELGLTSVIEGVESEDQLRIICEAMEVDLLQGYLFWRPLDLADLRDVLSGGSARQAPLRVASG